MTLNSSSSSILTLSEQEKLLKKLQVFKIQGRDKRGDPLIRIIGKLFPAKLVSVEAVKKYLDDNIFSDLTGKQFSIVYVNAYVNKAENHPGISVLKSIYYAIPSHVKDNLETVYFLHPGFQSRLFLATFGRMLFSLRVRYVTRLEFLWDNVRRKEMEMPEFVYEDMEFRPLMDYGLESDHPRIIAYGDGGLYLLNGVYSLRHRNSFWIIIRPINHRFV